MNGEKFAIRVSIADRQYPLTINRSEEESFRKMAKQINDALFVYRQHYPGKETQDYMAMVMLQMATQIDTLKKNTDMSPVIEKLNNLNKEMEDFFLQEQVL
jgi:cell division protein ZapA